MSTMTLEPCPFCGTDDHETSPWPSGDVWVCRCGNPDCAVEVTAETPEAAVAKWNRRAHLAQPAQAVETVRAWPKFVQDECLEVLRNMDTELGATGRKSARIERLINAIVGMPAQAVDVGAIRDVIEQMRKASAQRAMPPHYEAGCYMAWIDDLTSALSGEKAGPVGDDLSNIGHLIATQDNRITAEPIFIVQQKRESVGHPDYDNSRIVWVNDDHGEAGADESAKLEAVFQEDGDDEPDGWRRLAVCERWDFVTACFTEQGCKDYLARDGHNLREPRIYASGSYRNEEWRRVRSFLLSLAAIPTSPAPDKEDCDGTE